MTPLGQRPLDLGADIVVCADTKAINGHSDTLMGHVATRDGALMARLKDWRKFSGSIPGPFEAWLVHRGLETLEVRLCAHVRDGGRHCRAVGRSTNVSLSVRYPGLKGDPAHAIAARQMASFGFMIVADPRATRAAAERFICELSLSSRRRRVSAACGQAPNGGRAGATRFAEGFVRLSIGIEPLEPCGTQSKMHFEKYDGSTG